jgi:prevent-host-death family protein
MNTVVNVHEAKTHFSQLLERVARGDDIVIDRAGHPVARLKPYQPPRGKIAPPGRMKGKIRISPDFDEPIDELFDCLKDGRETR